MLLNDNKMVVKSTKCTIKNIIFVLVQQLTFVETTDIISSTLEKQQ